jgi:large subunit ribosomal protein L10
MKSRATKQQDLDALREELTSSASAFLVEFRGLTVVDVDELRAKIRGASGSYRVVKNTLARAASKGTSLEPLGEHFTGPTAMVVPGDDVPGVAKILVDFAKSNTAVTVKAGVVEGSLVLGDECKAIAEIPSREELQSKLAYLLQSPLQRLATVLNAPNRNLAVVLSQVASEKKED